MAALGANVTAFDFSANMIEKAKARENLASLIDYRVVDATDEQQLLSLGWEGKFSQIPLVVIARFRKK